MKHIFFALLLITASNTVRAQELGLNLSFGVRKTISLSKKSSLVLRQQLQLTPEVKKYNNKYGDFFNEDGFWSIPDRYRDDDESDDDDDDDLPPGAGSGIPNNNGELNDAPKRIKFDHRSITTLQYNYQLFKWLRANSGYSLFYNWEEFRHTFRAELDYRPLRHFKGKRKLDLSARALYQYIGNPDDGEMEWDALLVPRFDAIWAFDKKHILTLSNALNGEWSKGVFSFERWRTNASITYIYEKTHRFTFAYQYQQRFGKSKYSQGISFGYEVRF